MTVAEYKHDNAAWAQAGRPPGPRLSVLTPFLNDDPRPLMAALEREATAAARAIELVLLDDGGTDEVLARAVSETIDGMALPTRLVRLSGNEGRAKGRNRLTAHARAQRFLFLDSDMLPDSLSFLATWLDLIDKEDPPVAFGGFSLDQTPHAASTALHRAMALRSDCLPAAVRAQAPEKHVFTSNLLVRRDVFETERFDEGFAGWGWEDVEWGMRVAERFGVRHIDNPATHLGLDHAATLAAKYEQSAANFARVVARHPEVVSRYPSYRAARVLKRTPGRAIWRPMLKRIAMSDLGPMSARMAAMRLYRAALYAEVV